MKSQEKSKWYKRSIKYLYDVNAFFVYLRKHRCPICGCRLKTGYTSKVINSYSEEAKNYDFSVGDSVIKGDLEFRFVHFTCPCCSNIFGLKEIKSIEKKT